MLGQNDEEQRDRGADRRTLQHELREAPSVGGTDRRIDLLLLAKVVEVLDPERRKGDTEPVDDLEPGDGGRGREREDRESRGRRHVQGDEADCDDGRQGGDADRASPPAARGRASARRAGAPQLLRAATGAR